MTSSHLRLPSFASYFTPYLRLFIQFRQTQIIRKMGSNQTCLICLSGPQSSAPGPSTTHRMILQQNRSNIKTENQLKDWQGMSSQEHKHLDSGRYSTAITVLDLAIENVDLQIEQTSEKDERQKPNHFLNKKIELANFQLLKMLGKGAFSQVFLAQFKNNPDISKRKICVIKQMQKKFIKQHSLANNIILEKQILRLSRSKFITKMYGSFRDDSNYYLIMQWAQQGDLYDLFKHGGRKRRIFKQLGQEAIRFIIGCVVLGLEYLHMNGIVYADLKPENILIFEDGYLKLSDFGLSKQLFSYQGIKKTKRGGTKLYAAPEVMETNQFQKESDLWALGVLAYEMSNMYSPFQVEQISDQEKFVASVKQGEKQRKWRNNNISIELKQFIDGLLKLDPQSRLGARGFSQVKVHDFFKNFDWMQFQKKRLQSPLFPIFQGQSSISNDQKCFLLKQKDSLYTQNLTKNCQTVNFWSTQNSQLYK